jgi:hypothetical protein
MPTSRRANLGLLKKFCAKQACLCCRVSMFTSKKNCGETKTRFYVEGLGQQKSREPKRY